MLQPDHSALKTRTAGTLNTMFLLCKHLSLYSEDNKIVEQTTTKLMQDISDVRDQGGDILVTVAKHGFLVQGEFIKQKNQLFSSFARRMFQHGISSFAFVSGLTVHSLYAFLRLLLRKPAETWDEGGIGICLTNRNVVGIQLTEMSESDFRLLDSAADKEQIDQLDSSTDLWSKFARSIFNSLTGEEIGSLSEGATPAELADRISELLSGRSVEEKETLTLELTRFVTTLQREKMKTARTVALLHLADFVNNLTDDLRKRVLSNIGKLQMPEEYIEEFFNGLSDQSVIDAFREATTQQGYTPPVIMSLISKLAGSRKLVPEVELAVHASAQEEMARKVKELFRPDEFKKYVPDRYQKALMQVLSNQTLPGGLTGKLQELKQSLEDFQQDQQMARLSLFILNNNPDNEYIEGLRERLIGAMQVHLDAADYTSLITLCRACFADKAEEEVQALVKLLPNSFAEQILGDAARLGKDYLPQIAEVIDLVGDSFVLPLLEVTATENDRSVRFFYLSCLKKLGGKVADHAVLFLGDERWFVQRNMLILLGELGAKDKLSKIRPLLGHNHQKVRQEALKTCLLLQDEESIQELINHLSSKNRQEVLHAVTMSQLVDDPRISAALLNMLQLRKLFSFDYDVSKALVQALSDHQNPEALSVFAGMLKSRRLFQARPYNKLKVNIVRGLGKYPTAQVSALLKQQINNGTAEAASQASQILKKLSQEDDR